MCSAVVIAPWVEKADLSMPQALAAGKELAAAAAIKTVQVRWGNAPPTRCSTVSETARLV